MSLSIPIFNFILLFYICFVYLWLICSIESRKVASHCCMMVECRIFFPVQMYIVFFHMASWTNTSVLTGILHNNLVSLGNTRCRRLHLLVHCTSSQYLIAANNYALYVCVFSHSVWSLSFQFATEVVAKSITILYRNRHIVCVCVLLFHIIMIYMWCNILAIIWV